VTLLVGGGSTSGVLTSATRLLLLQSKNKMIILPSAWSKTACSRSRVATPTGLMRWAAVTQTLMDFATTRAPRRCGAKTTLMMHAALMAAPCGLSLSSAQHRAHLRHGRQWQIFRFAVPPMQ